MIFLLRKLVIIYFGKKSVLLGRRSRVFFVRGVDFLGKYKNFIPWVEKILLGGDFLVECARSVHFILLFTSM